MRWARRVMELPVTVMSLMVMLPVGASQPAPPISQVETEALPMRAAIGARPALLYSRLFQLVVLAKAPVRVNLSVCFCISAGYSKLAMMFSRTKVVSSVLTFAEAVDTAQLGHGVTVMARSRSAGVE